MNKEEFGPLAETTANKKLKRCRVTLRILHELRLLRLVTKVDDDKIMLHSPLDPATTIFQLNCNTVSDFARFKFIISSKQ